MGHLLFTTRCTDRGSPHVSAIKQTTLVESFHYCVPYEKKGFQWTAVTNSIFRPYLPALAAALHDSDSDSKHDMLVDVQEMRCVLAVYFTHFVARKMSLSPTPDFRHAPLHLGSKVFSMWMNLRLFHCIYGHHILSDMQCDFIRKNCPPGPFLLIRDTISTFT